ncbi:hypothetical protein QTG54_014383 [Skeletonema marinoi]|uniref:F-box domain-containing protein n=1 Tax=Skeletonema marinoi TaxID=267567 RepID=A0AAD9D6U0_9STRA|nr:hypothetical protein QTG54_014383 [Skeletonema marinoi]
MNAEEHDSYNKKRPSQGPYSNESGNKMKQQEEEFVKSEQHDYSGFASLPTDVLISILCRSPASDHKALRDTCKAFRTTIDSAEYKGERATSGWAEVSTHLLTGGELYDRDNPDGPEDVSLSDGDVDEDATEIERAVALQWKIAGKRLEEIIEYGYSELGCMDEDYGYHDITMDIEVDGKRCGSMHLVLLPRGVYHNYPFHEAADAHSSELQMVGVRLCDSVGRLKVRSIKNEELVSGEAGEGGFLHIKTVRINEAYQPMDCTSVVSEAVRSALTQPKLEGKWTLVTAISDYQVYMTTEEMEFKRKIRYGGNAAEKERADKRFWECALLDTKTLLRVGFKQIAETVSQKQNPYWLFALPCFLKYPIKSFEEVDQTPLIEPPDLPPEPVGVDGEILEAMKDYCIKMRQILDMLRRTKLELDKSEQNFSDRLAEMERRSAEVRTSIERGKPDHISDESWAEMVADVERGEEELRTHSAEIEESIQSAREDHRNQIDNVAMPIAMEEFQVEMTALVRKGGSIRKSHAIHCCSRFRITQFIDFLIDMIPIEERAQVLSSWDACGLTPLHCVVLGTPEVDDKDEYLDFVERLLGLGADTNVKSARGVTPLGQYRLTMTNKFDYNNVFGIRSGDEPAGWRPFHRKMEGLLRPYRGETDADVEAKCAVLDNDVDPNVLGEGGDDVNAWMDDDEDENMEGDEENDNEDDEGEE